MSRLHLTLGCGDYDLLQPLIDGTIRPDGVDLTVLTMASPERHWRMLRHEEFDVCELSLAGYAADRAASERFTAIPVFPHRRFRHSYVFVHAAGGVRAPADLNGRRVGVRNWQTTAGVWIRGILQDEHGVDLASIDWVAQDREEAALDGALPFRLTRAAPGETVEAMLLEGGLAAVAYPEVLPAFRRGDPRVRRLFEDAKAAELAYFRRTRLFPIMHTVVLKRALAERWPWLPRALMQAFDAAKAECYRRLRDPRRISLAFAMSLLEEQERELGPDPWAYGLDANRENLATLLRYAHAQALTPRRLTPDELFAPSTREAAPSYLG